jgi:hypothetical protein
VVLPGVALIPTIGVTIGFTVIDIVFDAALLGETQAKLEVIVT